MSTIIEDVKAYAIEHYEDGWDTLVECYEDADIQRVLDNHEKFTGEKITTSTRAIKIIGKIMNVIHDQMIDSWADGGLCTVCASPEHDAKDCPSKGSR